MTDAPAARRAVTAALAFGLIFLAAFRGFAEYAWQGRLLAPDGRLYQAATLAFNYFELGPIRRGLGGSLAHFLSADMLTASLLFHVLCAAAVAAACAWMLATAPLPASRRVAALIVVVALMLRWGEDYGRTDMAVATLLAGAAIAMRGGRLAIAITCVCVGLFIHETGFIYGVPSLVAMAMVQGPRRIARREWITGAAVVVVALGVYASLSLFTQVDTRDAVELVRGKFGPSKYVDWAIYYAISGSRGLATNICQNRGDPTYWMHVTGGLLAILAAGVAVAQDLRRSWKALFVAGVLPFLFLSAITNDISRWAFLACFNVWLFGVSTAGTAGEPSIRPRHAVIAAISLLLLINPDLNRANRHNIYTPSPIFERVMKRLTQTRTPEVEEALARCDPTWRDVLDKARER